MEIDTLFLSGCGTKGNVFIGSFKALIKHRIIDLKKIKRYVCCSGSSVIILLVICNYKLDIIHKLSDRLNYDELLDLNDLDILFNNLGVFSNQKIGKLVDCILYNKFKKKNITLKEFYNLTKKEFVCKVYNLSEKKEEYFSYQNHPDLKVSLLVQMTTCIPFFFKPIKYNNIFYIDGGTLCAMSFLKDYPNYLGIHICTDKENNIEKMNFLEYVTYLNNCLANNCKFKRNKENEKRIINIYCINIPCVKFDVCKDEKDILIENGYEQTIQHFKKFDFIK